MPPTEGAWVRTTQGVASAMQQMSPLEAYISEETGQNACMLALAAPRAKSSRGTPRLSRVAGAASAHVRKAIGTNLEPCHRRQLAIFPVVLAVLPPLL